MARYTRSIPATTVSTTKLKLLPTNHGRLALILQETGGTNDFRVGSSEDDLAADKGILIENGTTLILSGDECWTGEVWAVRAAAADASASVTEIVR